MQIKIEFIINLNIISRSFMLKIIFIYQNNHVFAKI